MTFIYWNVSKWTITVHYRKSSLDLGRGEKKNWSRQSHQLFGAKITLRIQQKAPNVMAGQPTPPGTRTPAPQK